MHPHAALHPMCADMKANYASGHVCWDDMDLVGGRATGVVRASFGYASTLADARAIGGGGEGSCSAGLPVGACMRCGRCRIFAPAHRTPTHPAAEFIRRFFLETAPTPAPAPALTPAPAPHVVVHGLYVYPIKSCGGFLVQEWPLGERGFVKGCGFG
jgi:molybdenum cofactor sulfurtransferase